MSNPKLLLPMVLGLCLTGIGLARDTEDARPDRARGPGTLRARAAEPERLGGLARQQMILNRILRDPELFRQAGITDEQAEALNDLMREQETRTVALRDELQQVSRKQTELLAEPDIDEDALMASVEELGRIQTEMARSRMEGLLAVRGILTPEQIEAAVDLVQERLRGRRGEDRPGMRDRRGEDRPVPELRDRRRERPEGGRPPRR